MRPVPERSWKAASPRFRVSRASRPSTSPSSDAPKAVRRPISRAYEEAISRPSGCGGMVAFLAAFPFQATGDALGTFVDLLPLIVLIVVLAGVMMWFLGWMSRYFEYLKTIESTWLDRTTLDFVRRVLEAVWIAFMAIVILAIAQTRSELLHEALYQSFLRLPAVFVFVFILFAAAIFVRVLHRF